LDAPPYRKFIIFTHLLDIFASLGEFENANLLPVHCLGCNTFNIVICVSMCLLSSNHHCTSSYTWIIPNVSDAF